MLTSLESVPLNFHTFASGAADPLLSEEVEPRQWILGGATMRTLVKACSKVCDSIMIQQNLTAVRHPMRSIELKHCTAQSTQKAQTTKQEYAQ